METPKTDREYALELDRERQGVIDLTYIQELHAKLQHDPLRVIAMEFEKLRRELRRKI